MKTMNNYVSSLFNWNLSKAHDMQLRSALKLLSAFLAIIYFADLSARAAIWYVDSSAKGNNSGTAWINAWTNLLAISGVKAGDTIYISGGPVGSSLTYSVSQWQPPQGTAGNPIVYQIGQDSNHNGTALFSGSGFFFYKAGISNIVFSGMMGNINGASADNVQHFQLTNYVAVFGGQSTWFAGASNFRFSYVNINNMICTAGYIFAIQPAAEIEIDNCNFILSGASSSGNNQADKSIYIVGSVDAYDDCKIHDCIFALPYSTSGGGWDGIGNGGAGISIYDNYFYGVLGYPLSHSSGQHQDGIQFLAGSHIKIFNNTFNQPLNTGIFLEATYGNFVHIRIYQNIIIGPSGGGFAGMDLGGDNNGNYYDDEIVVDNVITGTWSYGAICILDAGSTPTILKNSIVQNNCYTGSGMNININSSVLATDVIGQNPSVPISVFTNNFHLTATATNLIGNGVNYFGYFTSDKDGNPRPASGAWDIGAYQYQTSAPSTNPVISVSPYAINFGPVLVNTSVTNTFTVSNIDGGTLTGTATVAPPFSIVSGGTYSLSNNQGQTVSVSFNPTAAGSTSQAVAFSGGGASLAVSGSAVTNISPTVSAISANMTNASPLSIYAGAAVALSAMATNALTWQWSYTVNGGNSIVFQSGSGSISNATMSYDTNTIGSTYVWTLIVSNGQQSAQSQFILNVLASPAATSGLTFAAASGIIAPPFVVGSSVVGGVTNSYISQAVQTTVVSNAGSATFNFTITNAGKYAIQALVNAPTSGANSFYVNIDAQPQDPAMIWDVLITSGFEQRLVSWRGTGSDSSNQFVPVYFYLTAGPHQIIFCGREPNTLLSSFSILQAPQPPTGLKTM